MQGNIGAAKCAWDGRRGMAFRFLGTAYSLLYMGGSLNYGQKVSEQLVDKYGKEGLAYAIEWCKALEIENPGDDTWKKCVHPFLREAFLHCPKLKEELAKAIGEIQ